MLLQNIYFQISNIAVWKICILVNISYAIKFFLHSTKLPGYTAQSAKRLQIGNVTTGCPQKRVIVTTGCSKKSGDWGLNANSIHSKWTTNKSWVSFWKFRKFPIKWAQEHWHFAFICRGCLGHFNANPLFWGTPCSVWLTILCDFLYKIYKLFREISQPEMLAHC